MSEYKSDVVRLNASRQRVYDRLSNPENLRDFLDKIPADKVPADKLEQLRNVEVTADSITIPGGPVGSVCMVVDERREPELVRLRAEGLPISVTMELRLAEAGADQADAVVAINADLPPMLRPMVSGPLKQVVAQFATVLGSMPF